MREFNGVVDAKLRAISRYATDIVEESEAIAEVDKVAETESGYEDRYVITD